MQKYFKISSYDIQNSPSFSYTRFNTFFLSSGIEIHSDDLKQKTTLILGYLNTLDLTHLYVHVYPYMYTLVMILFVCVFLIEGKILILFSLKLLDVMI